MADLPKERLAADKPPFSNTGVDYFGPFDVKAGRSVAKRYGYGCSPATRRGAIEEMRSDNGTNLVGANADMKRALDSLDKDKISRFCLEKHFEWSFNPPLASHFDGIWERMIRSVRKILFHLLRGQSKSLNDEMLSTVFCEAESILNNRPLYDLDMNNHNDPRPITPNHLLLMNPKSDFPTGVFSKEDGYAKRKWRQVQYLASLFWKRWCEEYMALLQVRSKWSRSRRNVAVGDVVLIMESSVRNSWALGRVVRVECDSKGYV
ncbi:uncharacterized protein LOC141904336 [Tubulanus polymorphus]|uniref:uncharacterized protein LOC141904336 n=1 Tax=Tubulanus polymorphus TaxID=672921 RepID=UPI003DA673BD